PGGGANASAAVSSHLYCSDLGSVHPGWLTNRAVAIAYRVVAPMKNADWDRLVVPVLAMIGWPLVSPRPAAVPSPLVSAAGATSTSAAWSRLSTVGSVTLAGVAELPTTIFLITCGVWYTPLLASVAIVVACSSTVSDAWPSAVPAWSSIFFRPLALVSTPKALAMLTTECWPVWVLYATRCHRSV